MNFKSIYDIVRRVSLSNNKPQLGRWNIHNYKETSLKIKYATEDNCGISSHNYKNTMLVSAPIQQNNHLDDKKYIFMMGYESTPTLTNSN
jgi:hypothetical protein